jgi:hypothetical protein
VQTTPRDTPEFAGTARFEVRTVLGQGGFGRVYEAWDRAHGRVVALKTLQHLSSRQLVRFKTEFRSLADFVHPHVVALYELASEGDVWFFTMELVRGEPLLKHVGASTSRGPQQSPTWTWSGGADTLETDAPPTPQPPPPSEPRPREHAPDYDRIRSAFRQVADGVSAIHDAGMLHRDLKPSNVLVTPAGRAVLLDFGLVALLDAQGADDEIVGTPGYMAPEQHSRGPLGPPADWYAFGATLYEALCGRLPFEGTAQQVLWGQLHVTPQDPRTLAPDIPEDLASLAMALLAADPAARPQAAAVIEALGGRPRVPWHRAAFVGRGDEKAALEASARAVAAGRPVIAFVAGPAGIGKSALVRRMVDEAKQRRPDTLVLEGRCYERESVPFKALDDLVDRIGRHVRSLDPGHPAASVDRTDLGRLFPGLGPSGSAIADGREVRRRAALALRAILRALAAERPVWLSIDDVQWGDADSAELLEAVLAPPEAPGVLLVATCRSEGVGAVLPTTLLWLDGGGVPVEEIYLEALPASETERLAAALVGDPDRAARLARESGGHPFVLQGLVRGGDLASLAATEEDRRLLEAVVTAGRPVSRELVRAASGIDDDAAPLARLRLDRLVRASGTPGDEQLEPWHDRIREAVAGAMGESRAAMHARWATVLGAAGVDPEWRLLHHREAGQRAQAAACAVQAADHAAAALAFHHAAELYREAVSLGSEEPGLHARLAEALVNCGRSPEAAEAWLQAAVHEPTTAVEHRRRAAEQFLLAGIADRGREVADQALAPLGMRLARFSWGAAVSMGYHRLRLAMRGLAFTPKATHDAALLQRIDACWSIASAMSMVDTLRAYDFQAQQTRLSLEAGDPWRACRALALEAGYLAVSGPSVRARCDEILAQARALAAPLDDPRAHAMVALSSGIVEYLAGDLSVAIGKMEAVEQTLREKCRNVNWELSAAVSMPIDARLRLGRWAELSRRLPGTLAEARHTGNRYVHGFAVFTRATALLLAEDRPGEAQDEIRDFYPSPALSQPTIQDWWGHHGRVVPLLYQGEPEAALAALDAHWRAVQLSGLPMVRLLATTMYFVRGVAALQVAERSSGLRKRWLLWRAGRYVRALRGLQNQSGEAMGLLLDASRLAALGSDRAPERFERAEKAADASRHRLLAASARRKRGLLLGGDAGKQLIAEADKVLAAEGCVKPEKIARLYAP